MSGNEIAAILAAIGLTKLDPRDLGDRIPLVGGLQWPSEQMLLLDRLRAVAQIDEAAAQKH